MLGIFYIYIFFVVKKNNKKKPHILKRKKHSIYRVDNILYLINIISVWYFEAVY